MLRLMKAIILNIIFFLPLSSSWAVDSFISMAEDSYFPIEFKFLFESLRETSTSKDDKKKLLEQCIALENNLKSSQKDQVFLFLKTQIIRNVLESQYNPKRKINITTHLIDKLERSYEQKKDELHSFSKWIWNSILAELKEKQKLGIVTEEFFHLSKFSKKVKFSKKDPKLKELALKFSKELPYLSPWLTSMDSLSPYDFNQIVNNVSWSTLEQIIQRSILLSFSPRELKEESLKKHFFIINEAIKQEFLKNQQVMKNDRPSSNPISSLQDQSREEEKKAQELVDQVSADDLSTLSDEITKHLEEKAP